MDELEEVEVRSLSVKRGKPLGAVGQIRVWHHRIARFIAAGMNDVQVAALVDRSPATIANFRTNPANQQLIAQFVKEADKEVESELDYRARLSRLVGTMALELLLEKLEAGEVNSERALLAIADSTNNRFGLAPASISANINIDAGHKLAKARERVAELKKHKEIEGVVQGNVVKMRRW